MNYPNHKLSYDDLLIKLTYEIHSMDLQSDAGTICAVLDRYGDITALDPWNNDKIKDYIADKINLKGYRNYFDTEELYEDLEFDLNFELELARMKFQEEIQNQIDLAEATLQ